MCGNKLFKFNEVVSLQLKYYVYRLVDPRNNKTFYIGKGKGNRVYEHIENVHIEKDSKKTH